MLLRALCRCYTTELALAIICSRPRCTVARQQGIGRVPHGEGWLISMAGLIFNLIETLPGYAAVGTWGSAFCELPAAQKIGWDIHLLAY